MTEVGEGVVDDGNDAVVDDGNDAVVDDGNDAVVDEQVDRQGAKHGEGTKDSDEGVAGNEATPERKVVECSIRVGGVDFVLVPATRRPGAVEVGGGPSRGVNATKRRLWDARREARLTQAQLAKRLGRSQALVSQAESGRDHVSERYVSKVLEACELPPDWGLPKVSGEAPSPWDLDPRETSGIDPETLVPVRRGSERDLELRRTFVWWEGYQDET